jgi:ribonuclease G
VSSEIIINANSQEIRIAVMKNGTISDLLIERKKDQGIVGNVYKGKILKVLPGMQVAFVNLGLEKAGFLYVTDIDPYVDRAKPKVEDDPNKKIADDIETENFRVKGQNIPIEDLIREGQELLVQVTKDPIGTKGARISSYITLPGRLLVFMPTVNHTGVSRRIEDDEERSRLRNIISELKEDGQGLIVRTASEGKEKEDFVSDANFLKMVWDDIVKKGEKSSAPNLVYQDLDPILKTIRDLFTRDIKRLVIDSRSEYERCMAFSEKFLPEVRNRIELYTEKEPIFDAFAIEREIESALGRRVWLKSGGYIIIEQTEALTAIDVNTGKFVGKKNQEETILKTNLEAVKEIVYQIQLRNIGGLIIIDFIDMEKDINKEKVYSVLELALKSDRAKTNIMKISSFGLVEMTRKRSRDSLNRTLCEPCPFCEGKGTIKSAVTICYEIFREIYRVVNASLGKKRLMLCVSSSIADLLFDEESGAMEKIEQDLGIELMVKSKREMHPEQFEISCL